MCNLLRRIFGWDDEDDFYDVFYDNHTVWKQERSTI